MIKSVIAASTVLIAGAAALFGATPATAHVVPSTVIVLAVHETNMTADITLPITDLATASGISIPETGTLNEGTAEEIAAYVEDHFTIDSASGGWRIEMDDVEATDAEQWGTGMFPAVTGTARLTPPVTADLRSFKLSFNATIHQIITADIYVMLGSDWAAGDVESSRALGTITIDTVTGTVPILAVKLDEGSALQGFIGVVALGISHIAEGTDHQLFLLTLLLPAPLIAISGRWQQAVSVKEAVRRITVITVAFTIGHSLTLALGTMGLPVSQQPIEALIAVSILIAAARAVRPMFPGREPLIAGLFGLIHGIAFSTTLSDLNLSGSQLALSLLGFNLGIEIMQLFVVLLVLPPLIVLARMPSYTTIRILAAIVTAAAATGWLLDRVGSPNALGTAADSLGVASPWLVAALWVAAAICLIRKGRKDGASGGATSDDAMIAHGQLQASRT